MEVKKYNINGKEYIFVESIKIRFLNLYRCITNSGQNIFIRKTKSNYKIIKNKAFLIILNNMYDYNIKTDICESDNE